MAPTRDYGLTAEAHSVQTSGDMKLKYSLKFLLFNLAAVCALLGLEWYETHGGVVILPKNAFVLAIVLVSPVMTGLFGYVRCGFGKREAVPYRDL